MPPSRLLRSLVVACLPLTLTGCAGDWSALLAGPPTSSASPATQVLKQDDVPRGAALPPLDLSQLTWVADDTNVFIDAGDRLTLQPNGWHQIFYRPPLGPDFSLHFKADATTQDVGLYFRLMLDPRDYPDHGADGQALPTAQATLVVDNDGTATLRDSRSQSWWQTSGLTRPHAWDVAIAAGRLSLKLDGQAVFERALPAGYHPTPFLSLEWAAPEQAATLEDVSVSPGAPGARQAVVKQWSLEGENDGPNRFTLIYASDLDGLPSQAAMNTLPALLHDVVAAGGHPLTTDETTVFARTDDIQGGTHGPSGIDLSTKYLSANAVAAHEMSHGFGQGGSTGKWSPDIFLVEGLADFLGWDAYHRYLGDPEWQTPPPDDSPGGDPPLSEINDATPADKDAPLTKWRRYQKGRTFLAVLAAFTSYDDIRAVLAANKNQDGVTGESFVEALEARTHKDLAFLRPGWLVPGDYQRVGIQDAKDSDGDGLLDFQEIALGTDPDKADSDGDGVSDFEERAAGSDPLDAASKPKANTAQSPGSAPASSGEASEGE